MPSTIASLGVCSVRCPVGRRTESDWAANAIRSGGERNLVGWRTEYDDGARDVRQPNCRLNRPCLAIEECGIGIPPADLKHIFCWSLQRMDTKKVTREYDFHSSLFGISLRSGTSFRC